MSELIASTYQNFYTIGSFIPAVFAFFLAFFFFSIPKKSGATVWMVVTFTTMGFFYSPYFFASGLYNPAGAYHRWFTVLFVLLSLGSVSQILLRFPQNDFPRFASVLASAQILVAVGATAFFVIRTIDAGRVYHFDGHYWDFDVDHESRIIGRVIQLYMLVMLLVGIFRAIVTPSPYRWFVLLIALGFVLGTAPSGVTNIQSREGALDRGTHQIIMVLTSLSFFFVSVIVFLNTTRDRTTFMGKIVGISLVTFLIIMQFIAYFALESLDTAYDEIHRKESELIRRDPSYRSSDLRYVVSYAVDKDRSTFLHPSGGAPVDIASHAVELKNTAMWARFAGLHNQDPASFRRAALALLAKAHPEFKGYAGMLQGELDRLPSETANPAEAVLARTQLVRRKLLFRYNKIRQLPDTGFRASVEKFLAGEKDFFLPFRGAIEAHLTLHPNEDGAQLKSGVLQLVLPFQPPGTRIYRKHNEKSKGADQFVSFLTVEPGGTVVREAGFSYIGYRKYVHKPSRDIFLVLVAGILMVLIGFRVFFYGALVKPLHTLLEGVELVNVGDLTVSVPVKVQDEIGFLTASFNMMVATVNDGRDNLEQKVADRTRELQETLDQVQALKDQQDGDYFLTSLLIKPLGANHAGEDGPVAVEFFVKQKKTFEFRKWQEEIGGDLNKAHRIMLKGKSHVVFLNADAMGKSVQGAGGVLVLGSVFESLVERTQMSSAVSDQYPERWIKNAFIELQKVFESFDGSMLVSLALGVVDEESGIMYYINAEHPFSVLYRNGEAKFIEDELTFRKLGTAGVEGSIYVRTLQLEPGDVIIAGSDGRDDILLGYDSLGNRIINEDEGAFLRHIENTKGNLKRIYQELLKVGEITDDLALLRVAYRETAHEESDDHLVSREIMRLINESRAQKKKGEFTEALASLTKANELDNSRPSVIYELLRLFLDQKDFTTAAAYAEDYVYLRPADTEVVYIASVCFRKAGDLRRAADLGERVRLRSPRAVKNLLNLARIYASLGNANRAEMLLDDALAIDHDNVSATKLKTQLAERKSESPS